MGDAPLAAPGSWSLKGPHRAWAQGLIASAFPHLDVGEALLLQVPLGGGGGWLRALRDVAPVTTAEGPATPSVALAFTVTGLAAIGVETACLATFAAPFVEGMRQTDRQRRLGDDNRKSAIVPEGLIWSGNAPDPYALPESLASPPTPVTVHAALLLYHPDDKSLMAHAAAVQAALAACGVTVVRRIDLTLMRDKTPNGEPGPVREHFGFVDGISQPIPYGKDILTGDGRQEFDDPHGVAAGDILIGHTDADGERSPGPIVRADGAATVLPQGGAPHGYRDLGLDGSYLVIRELRQDVVAFWESMNVAAKALGAAGCDTEWLATRVVGRTRDGDPLCPGGVIPKANGAPANDFGFAVADPIGLGCPLGSHIRRANPRDGLAPKLKQGPLFRDAANNHRILRRGRKFGPAYDRGDPASASAVRGLLFMALNTDIARQFEFVQQSWVLNRNFATLYDETDPLVGPKGPFSVPVAPFRQRVEIETFVHLAGGDYFFLPSLPALKYLEEL